MLAGAVVGFAGCVPPVASGDQILNILPGQNVQAIAGTVTAAVGLDVRQPQGGVNNFYFNSMELSGEGGHNLVTGQPASFHLTTAATLAAAQAVVFANGGVTQLCPEAEDGANFLEPKIGKFQSITNINGVRIAPQSGGVDPGQDPVIGVARNRMLVQPGALGWVASAATPIVIEMGAPVIVKKNQQTVGAVRINYASPARLTGIKFPLFRLPAVGQNGNLLRIDVGGLPQNTQVTAQVAVNGNPVLAPAAALTATANTATATETLGVAGFTASLDFNGAGLPAAVNSVDAIIININ